MHFAQPDMKGQAGHRYLLFKLLLVVGGVLGLLQLYQSISSYLFISDRMVEEALYRDAARHLSFILRRGRETDIQDTSQWGDLLDQIRRDRSKEIAWLKIVRLRGQVLAESGNAPARSLSPVELRRVFEPGARIGQMVREGGREVFVTLQPFRFRLGRPPGGSEPPANGAAQAAPPPPPGPMVIEIALYPDSVDPVFGPLRRYVTISLAASIALLAAMVFLALRFGNFLRGKQLEQQIDVARQVQQDLLPDSPSTNNLDVAALCDPAWQVGGDFYDVFSSGPDSVSILLGDVAGKGMPAALLMAMLHGAVRSAGTLSEANDLREASRRLNELIHARTSIERYVTMFWCKYDERCQLLRYVNAGHIPPFLVRDADGESRLERLEAGGPVLGVIPSASYEQGEVEFRPGDLLVVCSDGVVEATGEGDEEFGDERLAGILRWSRARTATDLRDEILAHIRRFCGGRPQADDLTLLVVRAGVAAELPGVGFATDAEVNPAGMVSRSS